MALLQLLKSESAGSQRSIALAAVVSGAANAVILSVINEASQTASYESLNLRYLVMFLIAIALYILGLKSMFDTSTQIFEKIVTKVRMTLVEKIANSELELLDKVGKAEILKRITQDTTVISESQGLLVAALQSTVMVCCTAVYVYTISFPAFLTIICMVIAGSGIYMSRQKEMGRYIEYASNQEILFVGLTSDLIDGLKEIKLNNRRGKNVLKDLSNISKVLKVVKIKTTNLYNLNAVFSQCFFYILIGTIVFILPRTIDSFAHLVPQLVAAILFLIGPLSTVVTALPAFGKANLAAESMMRLERTIDAFNAEFGVIKVAEIPRSFERAIEVRNLSFDYFDQFGKGFSVGPLNVTLEKGKLVMIIGGNGSGKTTLLKLITALYFPSSGDMLIDGELVRRDNLQGYRELFSAIYTDFHLFKKLYGLEDISDDQVNHLITKMEMGQKTACIDQCFTTLDLSTGQRKRLAMVVELLEDRPIMVFDEWAADQDPTFRRRFYETILPELRARGKTLLVATHDDRFFPVADVVIKMELGKIISIDVNNTPDHVKLAEVP